MRNKEKDREYEKEYYRSHKEQIKKSRERYREAHREIYRELARKNYLRNKESIRAKSKQRDWEKKIAVLKFYGGRCACCGEEKVEFLAIDHIDGGGNKHRKEIKRTAGTHFYTWLIKNNFPDGFRVLCHNCNCSRGYYGYCPHDNPG